MRCPDCNKFVSYDEPECELISCEIESGSSVRANVRVVLKCQECGNELKDAEIEESVDFTHVCKPESERPADQKPQEDYDPKSSEDQFELESDPEPTGTDRLQTTDRNGKPIKSHRYMKTFYGFELDASVLCRACGETFDVRVTGEEQASGFNELV